MSDDTPSRSRFAHSPVRTPAIMGVALGLALLGLRAFELLNASSSSEFTICCSVCKSMVDPAVAHDVEAGDGSFSRTRFAGPLLVVERVSRKGTRLMDGNQVKTLKKDTIFLREVWDRASGKPLVMWTLDECGRIVHEMSYAGGGLKMTYDRSNNDQAEGLPGR